jgi:hypothetical protein
MPSPGSTVSAEARHLGGDSSPGGMKDGGKWVQGAVKHPGALRAALHVPEGETIPAKKLAKAAKSKNPTLRKRAVLAETLKKFPH